ncbi:hypothetical protein KNO15_14560 [Leifsonia shinshuensis]|uniref:ATP-binding protein n=1 Tax=Leifsonia shinshuensis TaxID=150026 RepID=UPI001F50CF39|nr:LuxR C-terminal-related transcriptional regulator [Leifsonia shinshuensis]MCI0157918.1 hypothetical protein [Leifsonia shinshuensis]
MVIAAAERVSRVAALPAEYASFVDRREQMAQARAQLGEGRLLTVVGAGGIGKTRFAIRLAGTMRREFGDDVWFVDLTAVAPGGSVADQVATQLGLESVGRDQEAVVTRFFAVRAALLVIDNCEHVIDGAVSLITRLLVECPELTVIATSREDLRMTSGRISRLEPLSTPGPGEPTRLTAVELFLDRCASVLPDPSAAELADIAAICRRLEGVPLAIELAATRVRAIAPRQILERLDAPRRLLVGRERDAPPRQRSVADAIAWSYDLCTDGERALWRRMSVFAGGWTLAAAERLASDLALALPVIDVVESLLDKSIVRRTDGAEGITFSMLDLVRRFGLDSSTRDEVEEARLAHRAWHVERLQAMEADWYGPNQVAWLAFAHQQLPDLRTAVDFSVQRGDAAIAAVLLVTAWRVVWQAQGRFDELRRRGLEVLALGEIDTPELCQLLVIVGGIECAQGDRASGLARLDEAAEIAERLGDAYTMSAIPGMHGSVDSDVESSIAAFERSLALQGGRNLFIARGNVEERLALAYDRGGRHRQSAALRSALVRRAVRAGDAFETSYLLMNAGLSAQARGRSDEAAELLRQSLSLKQGMNDPVGLAQVEEALASVAAWEGDATRAAILLGAAHTIWLGIGGTVSTFPSAATALRPQTVEAARSGLGARAYDAAFERGRGFLLADGIAFALGAELPERPDGGASAQSVLTARERQVAALVGQGLTDRAIADRLVISRRTAEGHVSRSLVKLGFTSRSQLAAWSALTSDAD